MARRRRRCARPPQSNSEGIREQGEARRLFARKPSGRRVFCPWPALARCLQPAAGRCARPRPPWPRPKSLAAGLLLILKQALSDRNTFLTCFTDERGSGLEQNLRVSSLILAYSRLMGEKCLRGE